MFNVIWQDFFTMKFGGMHKTNMGYGDINNLEFKRFDGNTQADITYIKYPYSMV